MANKPSIEKAVEWTSELLEEKILRALDISIKAKKEAALKIKTGEKLPKRYIRKNVKDWVKRQSSLRSQIKELKRGLGGVILTDPEYYKETGLFRMITEKIGTPDAWTDELSEGLVAAIKKYGGAMTYTDQVNKFNPAGKVGHHRTALSTLRDAVAPLPGNVRKEFKRLALADGYQIGEEFIDYLDPAAHKRMNKTLQGILAEKNIKPSEKLLSALTERSAHAAAFGEESGFFLPKELIKKGASADEVYKYAKPYLELAKRASASGLQVEDILTSNRWNTGDELLKLLETEMPLQDTTPILNKMRVDLLEANLLDPKTGAIGSELKAAVKNYDYGLPGLKSSLVPDLPKAGLSVEDVYKNVWEPVDARGLKGLTRQVEPVTEAGQVLFSKTNDLSDAVKPVGGGVAALTADSFAPTGYNKLTEQAQKVGNKLVEAKDAANLKQLSTIGKRAAMLNPLMFGASTGLGALALQDRIKEVAANPDDPWLKFQLRLDQAALGADATGLASSAAALTGWGALAPAAAEITSNVASGASLALDFGRWVKDPQAREDTLEWWTSVYQRGSRGLIKGLQQVF
tara:strand:- start:49 stop:1770 length:1722 start_codon:yes stop_codon:yes gene_type:complete